MDLKRSVASAIRDTEIRLIRQALLCCKGNKRKTARLLNISYRGLLYKVRYYDLAAPDSRFVTNQKPQSTNEETDHES
jgi:DNA-binding NtrC family response regulator